MKYYHLVLYCNKQPVVSMSNITEVSVLKVLDKYLPLAINWELKVVELIGSDCHE